MDDLIIRAFLLSVIISPCIAFYYSKKRFLTNNIYKVRAVLMFLLISIAPVFIYLIIFLIFIGAEELLGKSVISELMGRSLILNVIIGIALSMVGVIGFTAYTASYKKIKNKNV